jgi:hypothetical protein
MEMIFKEWVDNTPPTLNANITNDLYSLYNHYGINYENVCSTNEIQKHLYQKIRDNVIGSQLYKSELSTLKDQLLLTHFIENKQIQPYFGILEIIRDAVREKDDNFNELINFDADHQWKNAISFAKDFTFLSPHLITYNLQNLKIKNPRKNAVSNSAIFLKSKGYKFHIKNGKIVINESEQRRIAKFIEQKIKILGGRKALKKIFKQIKDNFYQKHERYHLDKNSNFNPEPSPSIPYNYLLNLCVKYTKESPLHKIDSSSYKTWNEILEYSTAFASILDVEYYNPFSSLLNNIDTITQFLQDLALYDNLFSPVQLRPSDVSKIIRELFSDFSYDIRQELNWAPEEVTTIIENIFNITNKNLYPVSFKAKELYDLSPWIQKDKINEILAVLSHESNSVNNNFQIPQDIHQINHENYFYHKPLICISKKTYLLTNSSICAPAFYEAIISEIRSKVDSKINDKLGIKIENLIKKELSKRGIDFYSGNYKNSQNEIDILVETSDTLIFLEVKAKPLTRKARAGSDFNLYCDLSDCLLTSQMQINKHEIFIRKNGFITLKDGSTCYLNNKTIAKLSITLFDFGSFQDRNFVFQFLENMLFGQLESNNNSNKINGLNKKLNEFQEQLNKLTELDCQKIDHPFYNSWFLSVPQLLIILDNVNSNDELKHELWKTRHFTTTCFDFYQEYETARKINSM